MRMDQLSKLCVGLAGTQVTRFIIYYVPLQLCMHVVAALEAVRGFGGNAGDYFRDIVSCSELV